MTSLLIIATSGTICFHIRTSLVSLKYFVVFVTSPECTRAASSRGKHVPILPSLNEFHHTKRPQSQALCLQLLHLLSIHCLCFDELATRGIVIRLSLFLEGPKVPCASIYSSILVRVLLSLQHTLNHHYLFSPIRPRRNIHHAANAKHLQHAHGAHSNSRRISKIRSVRDEARRQGTQYYRPGPDQQPSLHCLLGARSRLLSMGRNVQQVRVLYE